MKYFLRCILFVFVPVTIQAQTLTATYAVTSSMNITLSSGQVKQQTINYSGILYRKGNRYIYFEKPDYLSKYPSGQIKIDYGNYNGAVYDLGGTDTIQFISYADYDSLLERWRINSRIPGVINNSLQYFDSGFLNGRWKNQWQIGTETKEINGLHCRYALLPNRWEVWYCPDIPIAFGVYFIVGLPGLVVEANKLSMGGRHFVLESYTTNTDIPDSRFWPAEFNEPFKKMPDLKDKSAPNNTRPTKQQKQVEILNQ